MSEYIFKGSKAFDSWDGRLATVMPAPRAERALRAALPNPLAILPPEPSVQEVVRNELPGAVAKAVADGIADAMANLQTQRNNEQTTPSATNTPAQ